MNNSTALSRRGRETSGTHNRLARQPSRVPAPLCPLRPGPVSSNWCSYSNRFTTGLPQRIDTNERMIVAQLQRMKKKQQLHDLIDIEALALAAAGRFRSE